MSAEPPAFAVLFCAECGAEVTVPANPETACGFDENCPKCGAYLWEDDEPDDLPSDISAFAGDL